MENADARNLDKLLEEMLMPIPGYALTPEEKEAEMAYLMSLPMEERGEAINRLSEERSSKFRRETHLEFAKAVMNEYRFGVEPGKKGINREKLARYLGIDPEELLDWAKKLIESQTKL